MVFEADVVTLLDFLKINLLLRSLAGTSKHHPRKYKFFFELIAFTVLPPESLQCKQCRNSLKLCRAAQMTYNVNV
jgi:hypothetical protein